MEKYLLKTPDFCADFSVKKGKIVEADLALTEFLDKSVVELFNWLDDSYKFYKVEKEQ